MQTSPQILETACEWHADAVAETSTWIEALDARELDEVNAALRHALAKSDDVLDIGPDERDDAGELGTIALGAQCDRPCFTDSVDCVSRRESASASAAR